MKKTSTRTTRTFSITVPADLKPQIKRLAQESGRTVSSYLSWLISRDTQK